MTIIVDVSRGSINEALLLKELAKLKLNFITESFEQNKWYIVDQDKIKKTKHFQSGPYSSENEANEEFKTYSSTKLVNGKLVNPNFLVVDGKRAMEMTK
jgi:replication fork clamp-binding protein CrfC